MGRDLGPKCKLCRREGTKLFLKGDRCNSAKCSIVKRKYPPGVHGPAQKKGGARLTEYGYQLRAKQSAKRIYGILEKQFSNYYKEASKKKGDTGEILLGFLERRLDNVIYRSGIATSRNKARQMVTHAIFTVNGRSVDIPSIRLNVGDVIKVKDTKKSKGIVKDLASKKAPKNLPSWLEADLAAGEIKILSLPKKDDIVENIDDKLIVEFYSRK